MTKPAGISSMNEEENQEYGICLQKNKMSYKVLLIFSDIYYRTQPDWKGIHRKTEKD